MNFKQFNTSDNQWHDIPYYQHKTATDTLTLPATLYPNDTSVTVGIKGNTTQSGTPTPQNPVDVLGTGERTGNLWDGNYENGVLNTDGTLNAPNYNYNTTMYIPTEEKNYTLSVVCNYNAGLRLLRVCFYDENKNFISCINSSGFQGESYFYEFNFTAPVNSKYLRFSYIFRAGVFDTNIMLNLGSTALPYEPYGYKIPILLNSTTINKYLGEVQTVRQIKKLVLDGTEEWQNYSPAPNTYRLSISNIQSIGNPAICSHFVNSPISEIASGKFTVGSTWIYIRYADVADLADFRSYLAQQYANGTPVTIYYVLSTPQTATVNEPLMKIGDYADSLTTSIPCTAGENTLDVQTTVQPSEVTAEFSGWHPVQSVHERENGAWT